MKKLLYLSIAAMMLLAVDSCNKDNKQQEQQQQQQQQQQPEDLVNPLPYTVWTASWSYVELGLPAPIKATLVFEDKMVRLLISTLEIRWEGIPCIIHGSNEYKFEKASDGSLRVSFTLSFQSGSIFHLPETTFTGTYNPDSDILRLNSTIDNLGMETLDFVKESKLTTKINPLPATTWTATWNTTVAGDLVVTYKAILAFESSSVNMVFDPDTKVDNTPVIMYGNAPYSFQYQSGTDGPGNISFTMSTRTTSIINLPETTYTGTYDPDSGQLTLNVPSESGSRDMLGKDSLTFAKD